MEMGKKRSGYIEEYRKRHEGTQAKGVVREKGNSLLLVGCQLSHREIIVT